MALNDVPPPPYAEEHVISSSDKKETTAATLTLYSRKNCPYCKRVFDYLEKEKRILPIIEVDSEPKALEQLILIGGKKQFPCLIIDEKTALYESFDIIEWLKEH